MDNYNLIEKLGISKLIYCIQAFLFIGITLQNGNSIFAQTDTLTYVDISDPCKRFIILPDNKVYIGSICDYDIDFKISFTVGDRNYYGRAVFEILADSSCSLNPNENVYNFFAENTDIRFYRASVIYRDSFIIFSGLKLNPLIKCHYQSCTVLERNDKIGCFQAYKPIMPLIIKIENYKHGRDFLIAMDQDVEDQDLKGSKYLVTFRDKEISKTIRTANPLDFVSQNYLFQIQIISTENNDTSYMSVPAIFESMPSIHAQLENRLQAFEKYRHIIGASNYFVSCPRFNPGRDYVNEKYGEDIGGNVLSFTIYSTSEYLR